ncbi:Ig-like domain-containing protein [Candidatus Entotheonella palauensis]|uniref:Ig-like domain-containing protein n=1 Tax=Candidatus Entotheonella palauensis TaxID=93172 RepID=UPI0011775A22|nr:Ig-like domain-containing protein [Candidatus Entotheonella palauensis]
MKVEPAVGVNPPCTQHKIVAQVLDHDNKPVRFCPVEWTLPRSRGAVGAIVEGGRKRTNTYARTLTDLDGKASITLTSTQEGRTPFIAFVRDIKNPKLHKVFGVKYWLKAGWAFPADDPTPAGGSRYVTTSVYRASCDEPERAPLPGYRVGLTILGGPTAYFKAPDTDQQMRQIEIETDTSGLAKVELFQPFQEPGKNKIAITIKPPDDPDRLCCPDKYDIIAEGEMTQTWTQ